MKVPLVYPKIPYGDSGTTAKLNAILAFEKLDGSCIWVSYCRKTQLFFFGTRRDSFPWSSDGELEFIEAHPGLDDVRSTIKTLFEETQLDEFLTQYSGYQDTIKVFFEFLGQNSFAGMHQPNDSKVVTLIDVEMDGKMLEPERFIKDFGKFGIPKIVYRGKYTGKFVEDVRKGKFLVDEGVVCKGIVRNKGVPEVQMIKVKTLKYIEKLQKWHPDQVDVSEQQLILGKK